MTARMARWRVKNREKYNAYHRDWWHKNKDKMRQLEVGYRLKRKYGITQNDYDEMLLKQGGHCALCDNTAQSERYGRLNVDHCHETGRVRGILCTPCNHAIGRLGDTAKHIEAVLRYLRNGA